MVNVASVMKAIVLQLKALFLPVGIATTESNQDDQREPDYPVCMCVHSFLHVLIHCWIYKILYIAHKYLETEKAQWCWSVVSVLLDGLAKYSIWC